MSDTCPPPPPPALRNAAGRVASKQPTVLLSQDTSSGPSAESAGRYVLSFPTPHVISRLVVFTLLEARTEGPFYPPCGEDVRSEFPGDGMVLVDAKPVTTLTSGAVLSGSRSVPDILTKRGIPPAPLLPARRAGHPPGGQKSVPGSRELSYLHDTSDTQPMSPGPAYLVPGFSSSVSQAC